MTPLLLLLLAGVLLWTTHGGCLLLWLCLQLLLLHQQSCAWWWQLSQLTVTVLGITAITGKATHLEHKHTHTGTHAHINMYTCFSTGTYSTQSNDNTWLRIIQAVCRLVLIFGG